jgi:RNA polymerase sigma-70 factor (ECF subfamily)
MSGSETVAEDVTQEAFMVLMRDTQNYDAARGSVAAYLYGVARNLVLRSFQKERAYVALPDDSDDERCQHETLIARQDPLGDLTRADSIARLRQAVLALPAHYREVVVLCELHEMSYAEAAAALDCAVGTVRSRLHRGRAMLSDKLRAAGSEGTNAPAASSINTARYFA